MNDNIDKKERVQPIVTNQISEKNNWKAITSLILGVFSILLFWILIYPVVIGITGIITAIISLAKNCEGKKIAIAGLVLSIIGTIIGVLGTVFTICLYI